MINSRFNNRDSLYNEIYSKSSRRFLNISSKVGGIVGSFIHVVPTIIGTNLEKNFTGVNAFEGDNG